MDFPEPVGPTTATVRPGGMSSSTPASTVVPGGVGEPHARAVYRGPGGAGARRQVPVHHEVVHRQHRRHPPPPGQAVGQVPEHPAHEPHRDRQQGEQVGHGDQVAGGDRPAAQAHRPDHEEHHGPHRRERLDEGPVEGPEPVHLDEVVAQRLRRPGHPLGFVLLPAQGLDRQGAVEALVGDPADHPPAALHRFEGLEGPPGAPQVDGDDPGQSHQRDQPEQQGRSRR